MKTVGERVAKRSVFNKHLSYEISIPEGKLKNTTQSGVGLDISSHGLGIETEYHLKEGSVLKCYLPLRETEATIPVFAQVIWVKPADGHFRAGFRFLS